MNPSPALAHDKRTIDADGRMRVAGCRISKANVCPYFGREIPGFEMLGLDADRVYMMYRDPEELRKAAPSFEGVPLLDIHVPVTADSHAPENTVGTITNPRFEYPYLVADLVVWTQDAKDLIESGEQRELSSAYRYTPDMTSGTSPEGLRYDGRMIMLNGNHLALVREGRAGPDVMVADEKPALMNFPKLAAALAKLFANRTPGEVVTADSALAAEVEAMDAGMTDEQKKAACDSYAKELGKDAESLSDEEKTEAYRRAAADGMTPGRPAGSAASPALDAAAAKPAAVVKIEGTPEFKVALDAAIKTATDEGLAAVTAARDQIAQDASAAVHALYAARDAVAERAGLVNLTEHKTAEAVYRYALDKLTVAHKDVPAAALAALWASVPTKIAPAITTDAKPFNPRDIFPGLAFVTRG